VYFLTGTWQTQSSHKIRCEPTPRKRARTKLDPLEEAAFLGDVNSWLNRKDTFTTVKELTEKHGITAAYFKYWYPGQYAKLIEHNIKVERELVTQRKATKYEAASKTGCKRSTGGQFANFAACHL
jgi:hypothetical protein